ncbi:MAG: valine--tRNA ligase, partial [Nitrospinota bacterium]
MTAKRLEKRYDPHQIEEKWYRFWEEQGYFHADPSSSKPPYAIVIPPPNITGSLHMGHALNNTLQDILIRWKRMQGFNTLWLPGTDHAGIATQYVVEQQLARQGLTRQQLGREEFLKRVWEWRKESGGTILRQLRKLGASCDWQRERFTMDEGLSRAVREVFVTLYEEGYIYRDAYIINWCPRCLTALSDLEAEHEEVQGHLYYIRYPLATGTGSLTVATTRPETMLGDTAVAVHPEDPRYTPFIGQEVLLPLTDRKIPVIADSYVDPEFGTGVLKITPAHDPYDFEVGNRHHLPRLRVINDDGTMNSEAGAYQGLDRFACRERVIQDLTAQGLLEKVEPYTHSIGHCYRCRTIVEPLLSTQWFVRIKPLAEPAIAAVREKRIRIIPPQWEATYFNWMLNIKDWCISRQLWWGHRIPAWYCQQCSQITVARETPTRCQHCHSADLVQEEDVLDTWFSSGLWPFSTLGWPERTADLQTFYPTSVLVTAFDILFFWVARMIMFGLKFMGDVPFRDVYIHALVRDAEGQKMSKSRGNVIDPLTVMERYGTDAFRFTLAAFAAQGRDIRLSEERIAGYRNFVNKIWNAFRFSLLHFSSEEPLSPELPTQTLELADRWILSRLARTTGEVNTALEEYRFNDAAGVLYQFFW